MDEQVETGVSKFLDGTGQENQGNEVTGSPSSRASASRSSALDRPSASACAPPTKKHRGKGPLPKNYVGSKKIASKGNYVPHERASSSESCSESESDESEEDPDSDESTSSEEEEHEILKLGLKTSNWFGKLGPWHLGLSLEFHQYVKDLLCESPKRCPDGFSVSEYELFSRAIKEKPKKSLNKNGKRAGPILYDFAKTQTDDPYIERVKLNKYKDNELYELWKKSGNCKNLSALVAFQLNSIMLFWDVKHKETTVIVIIMNAVVRKEMYRPKDLTEESLLFHTSPSFVSSLALDIWSKFCLSIRLMDDYTKGVQNKPVTRTLGHYILRD